MENILDYIFFYFYLKISLLFITLFSIAIMFMLESNIAIF